MQRTLDCDLIRVPWKVKGYSEITVPGPQLDSICDVRMLGRLLLSYRALYQLKYTVANYTDSIDHNIRPFETCYGLL
jgi:hypothetical protein